MKTRNRIFGLGLLVLMVALAGLSAWATGTDTQPMTQIMEEQIVGGKTPVCWRAIGLGVSFAVASLSGCSVLCASLAWYSIGLMAVYCG